MYSRNNYNLIYTDFMLYRYLKTLPLKRIVLMKFFEKYRITKEEFDNWAFKNILTN